MVGFPYASGSTPVHRWEALIGLRGLLKKIHEVGMGYVDGIWMGKGVEGEMGK